MTITREQVADLQPGDVVEVVHEDWPEGTVVRGPLWLDSETLQVGRIIIRHWDGQHPYDTGLILTVVSRAPRPLYVNHSRTEPALGDIVRRNDQPWMHTWFWGDDDKWHSTMDGGAIQSEMPGPLRLLVDGETGQVVQ